MIQNRFKKILVPLDGSKNSFRGLDTAIEISRDCHAIIEGLYVVPVIRPNVDEPINPILKIFLNESAKFMLKAKTRAAKHGILFHDNIEYGDEDKEISEYANRKKIDLIVIGSRGRGAAKEIFLGSTSQDVIHKTKIPVLVVK